MRVLMYYGPRNRVLMYYGPRACFSCDFEGSQATDVLWSHRR
jgi:hypothetical protein